jgi:type I restriction enzyme M protein
LGDKGKVITANRHFEVFEPPRRLEEIDAGLKSVTAKIMTMLEGLAE